MIVFGKTLKSSFVAALLLATTTGAWGQAGVGGGFGGFGGESRRVTQITGKVVCVGCTLEEVRKAQPDQHHLYQLTHRQGQVVLEVSAVNDARTWASLTWPHLLSVRAKDTLFQQLTAEENLFKEVELTGLLRNTRTFDLFDVSVRG
jgi:hypothetical protein